ncbi:MAG: histidine phosphatase family protein [Saprospiraceae bacterium]|jgi:broad specificity phosphatase PhoE|nr:histidine phosphatase family protein [Saprospiraceae bacterium]MBK7795132.1 histidine phosphatase family protein [Saprospiraceae bacterium]MBL0261979.1 histidine phosphatase family protein [Saprospiraceae bacterium]
MKHNLYFIRHGETDENVKRIVQGCGVDSVLNENGLNQGKKFYEHYKNIGFKKMYCSALKRTYQTIQSFEKSHGKIQSDRRLNEISWGEHEGKSGGEEFMRKYFSVINSWKSGDYTAKAIGGESAEELEARCKSFLDDLDYHPGGHTLICTHGRTIRVFACILQNLPLSEMENLAQKNTGLYLFSGDRNQMECTINHSLSHLND